MRLQLFARAAPLQYLAIFRSADADEDAGVAAPETLRIDPRMFQRLPAHFEQQTLLWIGGHRLARRDPEELRVELAVPVQQRRPHRAALARSLRLRIEDRSDLHAFARNLGHQVVRLR